MRTAPSPGSNSETIRRDNLSAVLREVHIAGPRTRSELVALTGLNRSTVAGPGRGAGRSRPRARGARRPPRDTRAPSPMVHATTEGALVLAIGIAVHSLAVAIVGLGGVVHEQGRAATGRTARPTLDETLRGPAST